MLTTQGPPRNRAAGRPEPSATLEPLISSCLSPQ